MYEFETVEELKKQFYLDQYDELDSVSQEQYPEEPLWTELRPAEQFLVSADAPELGDALDIYTDALAMHTDDDNWPQQHQNELQRTLPQRRQNGVDPGYGDHFSIDIADQGDHNYMMFDKYVNTIQDELAHADGPDELQDLVEHRYDLWFSRFGDVFDDWYDCLWEAVHIGDPPIIDIVTAENNDTRTYRLHSVTADVKMILEEEIRTVYSIDTNRESRSAITDSSDASDSYAS